MCHCTPCRFPSTCGTPGPPDGGGSSGGGTTEPDPPTEPDNPWPGYIHDDIIEDALSKYLTSSQLSQVKDGSKEADTPQYQTIEFNHMHAMRRPGEHPQISNNRMMEYFVKKVADFVQSNDYNSLGMALHPIMDAYAQPHSGFKIFDTDVFSLNNIVTHWYEALLPLPGNRERFKQSVDATEWLTKAIISRDCHLNSVQ